MSDKKTLFTNIKSDLLSGLIVFLIALPLCLGIAQASGAPLFAGIASGIIGGIVIGILSKSQLSVSGPAAGLVAIVLVAIEQTGSFNILLCSFIIAGAIQLLLGLLRAGSVANYFPTNVIEGMLAGIGLTIIIKQIPDAVGFSKTVDPAGMEDADNGFIWNYIRHALDNIELGSVIIALVGLAILIVWSLKGMKKLQIIPAGLLVVVAGTLLNELFKSVAPAITVSGPHLVQLPVPQSASDFLKQFTLPDFSGFANPTIWTTGLVIAIVASIETLLCIEATDKLDPMKRYTSGDAELRAQGIGNMISGLIGGLPITSVIVRSSANINAGAKSKLSAIIHGILLLICVATIPFILNLIPKAALAAILIYTGYRLCRPAIFKHMWHAGRTQFIPFVVTAVAVVSLDLLKGVGLGLVISIFYILRNNLRIPYYYQRSKFHTGDDVIRLRLAQELSFLNKASIKKTLAALPERSIVILDASDTEYIDYDVLEIIKEFRDTKAAEKNIRMSLIGFKNAYKIPDQMNVQEIEQHLADKEVTEKTSGKHKKLLKQLQVQ
ncbi:MAG: SulP family inorganic anion transporter [Arachidicoccus sp.]|nr:SulP family inorganic anion transporter [Arachidicoccus sp.]